MTRWISHLISRTVGLAAGLAAGMALTCHSAAAQDVQELKIGLLATLSGPAAVYGEHMRDGFMLAVEQSNGALGGLPTNVIVVDDKLDPDNALEQATKLIEENGVDLIVGVNFSKVMLAVHDPIVRSKTLFIGTHSGPAPIAGRNCSRYFFSTASQDDQVHETMGRYASLKGYQDVVTIAPDYEAARDAVAAFRRHFKGQIARELFPKLGQTDFSDEFKQIEEIEPDAIFTFMPGGMGVELVKQFHTSGLKGIVPFLSSDTVNAVTLPYTAEMAEGLYSASHWAPNLDNPANKRFVREFSKAYKYEPSVYAAQGYDAAKLIHFALELTGGIKDQEALISAISAAPFESVRGDFRFNSNQFPIQDFYIVEGVRRTSKLYEMEAVARVFDDVGDAYAGSCRM
ncbi:ABC transporter substrate-binding protein [Labrenzia sp. CP4]|jgi:branched-chain amino acid transport system substrate-binding protein|uniref:ABC transporter substrate-binding protein n=1 Tax=Labrenzia sp. CP4 TaxID=1674922 RepID=UPI000786498F|nr:ABC transporter substrate-binding protein [Labrenzia sp. CP4]AMN53796.1 ABC transporter substrate-binding protein [Labrenzia sp. CP4]